MDFWTTYRKNFRAHLVEGALYISSGAFISVQTLLPALIKRLGGNSIAVGLLPTIVYLAFFLPQIVSANYIHRLQYRKPWVLKWGIAQRFQILLIAVVVIVFGPSAPALALFLFFAIYTVNQVLAGMGSPAWFDLVVKTTRDYDRGKLMGWRTSTGALLGFLNGFVLTLILTYFPFPYDYAATIGLAFVLQLISWIVLRQVKEEEPSETSEPVPLSQLYQRITSILRSDPAFKRFLISCTLLIVGVTPFGFFTVAALKKFSLSESYIGLFTASTILAQILGGVGLGWITDRYGRKRSLLVCALASESASVLALVSGSSNVYFIVFFLMGINLGAEMITRYNFAADSAPDRDRAMYIGLMNAWLAPVYLSGILAGWLVDRLGFDTIFFWGTLFTFLGIVLLNKLPEPKPEQLALSSK